MSNKRFIIQHTKLLCLWGRSREYLFTPFFITQGSKKIGIPPRKFKVALNPFRRIFLNFAKSCILSCWLQFNNKKWGSPSSFLSCKRLKLKLRVFLAGYSVTMVTYCVTKIIPTCSPMIGQFFWYHDCSINW